MSRQKSSQEKVVETFSTSDFASLPSKTTWDILTNLLYWSVLPLARNTTLIIDLCFLIIQSTTDKRRKISIYESDRCLSEAFNLIFLPPDQALKIIIFDMGLERWVISNIVQSYLDGTYNLKFRKTNEYSPEMLKRNVSDMYKYYLTFREDVCNRFLKLSNSQAVKNKWQKEQFGLYSDKGDNENNYFLSVIRAIDKLYPTKGTLANYVNLWLGNAAGSSFTLYTGEVFNLSRPVRQMIHEGSLHVNNKAQGLEKAIHIPIEEQVIDTESETLALNIFEKLQQIPEISFIYNLYDYPKYSKGLQDQLNSHLMAEGYEPIVLTQPDLFSLVDLKPLARSSRKETESSNKRRQALKERKNA